MSEVSKVSIGIPTYNHARYIRQALDSVLMQKADFPFEVVVHDDASTDGTREIVQSYASAHPSLIRAVLQEENQFSRGVRAISVLRPLFTGKYVALLDGDDAWTSPRKLAAQAAYLDAHPGCALCQTRSVYTDEATGERVSSFPFPEASYPRRHLSDLAVGNFVQLSAMMIRGSALPARMPDGFEKLPFVDYVIIALSARHGWIGLIDEEMTLYRLHESNFWANRDIEEKRRMMRTVRAYITEQLDPEDQGPWRAALSRGHPTLSRRLLRRLRRVAGV